jgi:hypothetical protein
MRVIDLYPRDFYVTIEISLREVQKIVTALGKAELKFDGTVPHEVEAIQFIKEQFYPLLETLYEENKKYVS